MKERPIIFNSEMVKAILEGRKTQTRRIVKPQPTRNHYIGYREGQSAYNCSGEGQFEELTYYSKCVRRIICSYGEVGDRLWVRETWSTYLTSTEHFEKDKRSVWYKATPPSFEDNYGFKWKPSIFMPRWASRITLEIRDVRVERLQEIEKNGVIAEGCYVPQFENPGWAVIFRYLWNSIHKKEYRWEDNPWVWVIGFKKIEEVVDE